MSKKLESVMRATEPCPDCKIEVRPVEAPPGVLVTLTDKVAAWRLIVSHEDIARSRIDPVAEAKLRLRHEQRKNRTCLCNGTGVVWRQRVAERVSECLPLGQLYDFLVAWRETGMPDANAVTLARFHDQANALGLTLDTIERKARP